MDLLFRREQTIGRRRRVNFMLWGKIEPDEEERALIARYRFDEAVLIAVDQPFLARRAGIFGFKVFFVTCLAALYLMHDIALDVVIAVVVGTAGAYWYYNEKRETIFVEDLLHGRNFKCESVIELAKKEAWLTGVVAFLRQVMVTAKHWDDTECLPVEPLAKEEARRLIASL